MTRILEPKNFSRSHLPQQTCDFYIFPGIDGCSRVGWTSSKNVLELSVGVESAKNEFVTVVLVDRVVRHAQNTKILLIFGIFKK